MLTAQEAKQRLREGNERYRNALQPEGDISPAVRRKTAEEGQFPYAVVITCSDSRVIPEAVFSAGIGELFVVRVAGNVPGINELGSVEYAADHLGTKLVVMLGHTRCGAIDSAIKESTGRFVGTLLKDIQLAIGDETDRYKASCLNVRHGVETIRREFGKESGLSMEGLEIVGAMYHVETGEVEWL